MLLVCQCGAKLKGSAATAGRVVTCPRCGRSLRMVAPPVASPDADAEDAPVGPPLAPRRPAPASDQARGAGRPGDPKIKPWPSLPAILFYPVQNSAGIGFLVKVPVFFIAVVVGYFLVIKVAAIAPILILVVVLGTLAILLVGLGHILSYFSGILEASCRGKATLPEPPGWDYGEITDALSRWLWAAIAGLPLRLVVPLLYLAWRGTNLSNTDRAVLVALDFLGLGYTQMILVLAVTRNSMWGAGNPLLVVRAIRRAGWGYLVPCILTVVMGNGVSWIAVAWLSTCGYAGLALSLWFIIAGQLYLSMIALRVLGFYCHRTRAYKV